jgi:hypothetical protein
VKSFFTRLVFRLFSIHVQENKGITQYTTSNYKHYITQSYQMTYSILDAVYQLCELNVILTQLQCSAAFLNNDLYESNILSSPNCPCGVPRDVVIAIITNIHIVQSMHINVCMHVCMPVLDMMIMLVIIISLWNKGSLRSSNNHARFFKN